MPDEGKAPVVQDVTQVQTRFRKQQQPKQCQTFLQNSHTLPDSVDEHQSRHRKHVGLRGVLAVLLEHSKACPSGH